jgi:ribosomal protein S18 acetylase RimI-like enzyme
MNYPDASSPIGIVEADLSLPAHQQAVLAMVDAYSRDAMGDGKPLDQDIRAQLIPGLRRHPTTLIFLAFDGDQPVGAAVCFIGFSTFAAKPLINIHDFVVLPTSRGKGIGRQLLEAVETKAKELGCCKLTLEVMDKNDQAVRMYQARGFERYALQEEAGAAIFMCKPLQ